MLEHQGCRQRHRDVERIARGQEARQDQHPLGVQRPAHLDLALDIDQLARARPHPGRDPARLTEGEGARLQHRQPVDLTDCLAVGVDQHRLAGDLLVQFLADQVDPAGLLGDGLRDMDGVDHLDAIHISPVLGLADQVGQPANPQGEALGVAGQPGGALDHGRAGGCGQRTLGLVAGDAGDQAAELAFAVG